MWDSYERVSNRLRRKIRNTDAAYWADVINYALYCAISGALQSGNGIAAKDIAHTSLLAELVRYSLDGSAPPEIKAIARHIQETAAGNSGSQGQLKSEHP